MQLGDGIRVDAPGGVGWAEFTGATAFDLYCKQHGITMKMLGCTDSNWTACVEPDNNVSTAVEYPGLYYHSSKFIHSAGISYWKNYTLYLRELGLGKAQMVPTSGCRTT